MARNKIDETVNDNEVKAKHIGIDDKMNDITNYVKDDTFQILEKSQNTDKIDFWEKNFNLGKTMLFSMEIEFFIESIEPLLEKSLTYPEKALLKNIIIEVCDEKNISNLCEFLMDEDNERKFSFKNIKFSFEEIKKIISLNLNREQLENLIRLNNELLFHSIIIKNIENIEILSDDIVNKAIKLHEIVLNHEHEMASLGMDLYVEDFILLKDINLSEELIKKIEKLLDKGVALSIKDLKLIDSIKINSELENKLERLFDKVAIDWSSLPKIQEIDMNEEFFMKIESLVNVWITLNWNDLLKLKNITLTQDDIKKLKYIIRQPESNPYYLDCLDFLLSLEYEDIDKITSDAKKLWFNSISYQEFEVLYKIPEEVLQYCNENWINNTSDIEKVKALYLVSSKEHMKDYIKRKDKYLETNRTLSEKKYIEYFWSKWKFGKHEIYQWNIWLCYLYSWLEIFKKMNWFDVFIQSNLIEKDDGWLVRIPLNIWPWIKVNKADINKTYKITNNHWKTREMNINSKSKYLWFKILEIAYIKMKLIDSKLWNKLWDGGKDNPIDMNLNGDMLSSVEGGDTIKTLEELFSSDCIIWWEIRSSRNYKSLKKAEEIRTPAIILDHHKKSIQKSENRINQLFDLFWLWLISIRVWINPNFINSWEWIKEIQCTNGVIISVDNVKIVNRSWQEISNGNLSKFQDVKQDNTWKTKVLFFPNHAYSVEKCYTDKNWEKRVRIVNPWHTDIKFDLSLDKCKILFDWNFWVINIDKLFR